MGIFNQRSREKIGLKDVYRLFNLGVRLDKLFQCISYGIIIDFELLVDYYYEENDE